MQRRALMDFGVAFCLQGSQLCKSNPLTYEFPLLALFRFAELLPNNWHGILLRREVLTAHNQGIDRHYSVSIANKGIYIDLANLITVIRYELG